MAISIGEKIPNATVMVATKDGPEKTETVQLLGSGTVALFSVPGAFTPTCSAKHLPGFVEKAAALKAKGVDKIVCMSVNDAFVMQAWGEAQSAGGDVVMMADGNADFANALGLAFDAKDFGMGQRSQRFSAVLNGGVVEKLNVEEGGAFEVSSAEYMLEQL
ncbi:MAG: peroxiredoxin [Pseudomonadota bacterium]